MLQFEIKRYIFENTKKIIITFFILIALSLYSFDSIQYIYLPENGIMNFGDYLIGELNMIQLIMFLAYPSLFSFLITDLIRKDFNNNYIELIYSRVSSKLFYLINKIIMLFMVAFCFIFMILFLKIIISMILGLPFNSGYYNYIFYTLKYDTPYQVYICNIILFSLGIVFIGMISLTLSIYIENSGFIVGIIIALGFFHNVIFVLGKKIIYLLPFSQYILVLHKECGTNLNNFSLTFSFIYMSIAIIGLFFFILIGLNKKEMRI